MRLVELIRERSTVRECIEVEYSSIPVGSAYKFLNHLISFKTIIKQFLVSELLDKVAVGVDFTSKFDWAVAMEKLMKK